VQKSPHTLAQLEWTLIARWNETNAYRRTATFRQLPPALPMFFWPTP